MAKKDPSLLNIQTKIGNSFLRAFYPIDYRNNQNTLKKIDELLGREVTGLKSMADTTGRVAQKIGRTFGGLSRDMREMQEALDRLQMTMQTGDEILSNRLQGMENAYDNIAGFLPDLPVIFSRRAPRGKTPRGNRPPNEPDTNKTKPRGKYTLPRGLTVVALAAGLYDMWQEFMALDPNMKKGEYRQAVIQILTRAVAKFGLVWVGAIVGAGVGGALGAGFGAIPGFVAGLIGGAAADYYFGESVDQLADMVVDYLYTGDEEEQEQEVSAESSTTGSDASIVERDVPTPPLDPINQQVSPEVRNVVPVSQPIVGPTPPAPPMLQEVDGQVIWPEPLPAIDMSIPPQVDDTSAKARAASNEALNKINVAPTSSDFNIPQSEEEKNQFQQRMNDGSGGYVPTDTRRSDTTATISTGQNVAGDITTQEGASGVKLNFALAGKNRSGRPDQDILNLVQRAAAEVGMSSITVTSGRGDYISESGRKKGQKSTVHSTGKAVDVIGFANIEQKIAFARAARALGAGGIGVYKNDSLHVDLGKVRHWNWGDPRFPPMAEGGKVEPSTGGTLALIAEAGEPEYVVPQSKAIKFAHEMIAARPSVKTKKHTHVLVVPILT